MSFDIVKYTPSADLATGGSANVGYKSGTNRGNYSGAQSHKILVHQTVYTAPNDFTVTFNAANFTITWNAAITVLSGTELTIQLERQGEDDGRPDSLSGVERAVLAAVVRVDFGAPIAADPNGVMASQSVTAAGGPATGLNGVLSADGVAVFDVPRNVVAAWTGAAVMTVTGTDEYGKVMRESSAAGTSFVGKKAFKTVTNVSVSADVTLATVGTGDVLGLPAFLPGAGHVLNELEDNVGTTPGVIVAGDASVATATTGDVRGTYDPSAAANGFRAFSILLALPDPTYLGGPQFAG